MDLFFFYGTLTDESLLGELLRAVPFRPAGAGRARGTLHDAGSYPALTLGSSWVPGRLFYVGSGGAALLDSYEGVGEGLYSRRLLPIDTPGGQRDAWTFVYELPVSEMRVIDRWPPRRT